MGEGDALPTEAKPPARDPASAFEDHEKEANYRAAVPLFLEPPRAGRKTTILLVSLGMFVLGALAYEGTQFLPELGTLIVVLLLHELGHALGMLAFGYRDVSIFFIPFFGAAASGRRHGVARWKQGLVLLLGPLPGLVLGCALFSFGADGLLRTAALQLVVINALNLLPVAPLDGGQLFSLFLFSRHRYLELGFLVLAGVVLIAVGLATRLWLLAGIGAFLLSTLRMRGDVLAAGARLRSKQLPSDPSALDEAQRRAVFSEVWRWMPFQWCGKPRPQAATMESVLESAVQRPTSLGASLGLFGLWLVGLAITGVGLFAWVATEPVPPAHWERYKSYAGGFEIELPATPTESIADHSRFGASRGFHREYGVTWSRIEDAASWMKVAEAQSVGDGEVLRELRGTGADRHLVVLRGRQVAHVRLTSRGTVGYVVIAAAPEDEADSERVVRSFRFLGLDELLTEP